MMTIAVIGGGAAGMMAALTAAENKRAKVVLFERQSRVGRKLAATGNGRCNLSNAALSLAAYHGEEPGFASAALEAFGVEDTLAWFKGLGMLTVTEEGGRVYPYSDTANSVVDVLRFACDGAGIDLRLGVAVTGLKKSKKGFTLSFEGGNLAADRVIICCGGAAGAKLGGVRDGYDLLRSMGHSISPLRPVLVQLKTDGGYTRALKGVRADATVTVLRGSKTAAQTVGEVQFTEYGLSGPAVFEISRAALETKGAVVQLDLMRHWAEDEVARLLLQRAAALPQLTAADVFTGLLHNRLGRVLLQYAGLSPNMALKDFTAGEAKRLAGAAKCFSHPVTGDMGFDNAQVTAGGAHTDQFDPATMESRIVPGLYAAGEVLDIDGDCGGYNLQWAWSSGRAAGKAAAGL